MATLTQLIAARLDSAGSAVITSANVDLRLSDDLILVTESELSAFLGQVAVDWQSRLVTAATLLIEGRSAKALVVAPPLAFGLTLLVGVERERTT